MLSRLPLTAAATAAAIFCTAPASAAVILITQQKAAAGNVTPGDAPGFPVTLSLPGAYRFDTNLTVPPNKTGIEVRAYDVSIDMAGFRLYGFQGAAKAAYRGIEGTTFGLGSVRNGSISGFTSAAIRIANNQWVVENMTISTNGHGILAGADYTRIVNNAIYANSGYGIFSGSFCHIEGNNVATNGGTGILLDSGMALENTSINNGGFGVYINTPSMGAGLGSNTVVGNDNGGTQVYGAFIRLHPNACAPVAC